MFEANQQADESILAGVQRDMARCAAPVRDDLSRAHALVFTRIARPGTWWTGAERVAIAAAARAARDCSVCKERKAALSPLGVKGVHQVDAEFAGTLPSALIDVVHFAMTDASRMTAAVVSRLADAGVSDAHYVEALGIAVAVCSIDQTCRGLGVPLHELPAGRPGEPSRIRPDVANTTEAFVPMMAARLPAPPNDDLWDDQSIYFGLRAMSLVPDAVRDLRILSAAQYLPLDKASDFAYRRALGREQMELLAGRVSAINQCFY